MLSGHPYGRPKKYLKSVIFGRRYYAKAEPKI
jgi:hypothetical protein